MVSDVEVRELAIPGAWEITPQQHADDRGVFYEWFTDAEFHKFAGHRLDLRQANCSVSAAGVLRGLHFAQLPPSQAKYVTCPRGAVFDVVVDIRVGSPTFGQWDGAILSADEWNQMLVPKGFAHGFVTLEENTEVQYKVSAPYRADLDRAIRYDDPAIGIDWPEVGVPLTLSDKDRRAPLLSEIRSI